MQQQHESLHLARTKHLARQKLHSKKFGYYFVLCVKVIDKLQ